MLLYRQLLYFTFIPQHWKNCCEVNFPDKTHNMTHCITGFAAGFRTHSCQVQAWHAFEYNQLPCDFRRQLFQRNVKFYVFTSFSYSGWSVSRRFKWIWIPVFHTNFLWSEINSITWAPSFKHYLFWIPAIATRTSIRGMGESLRDSSESLEDFKTPRDNG